MRKNSHVQKTSLNMNFKPNQHELKINSLLWENFLELFRRYSERMSGKQQYYLLNSVYGTAYLILKKIWSKKRRILFFLNQTGVNWPLIRVPETWFVFTTFTKVSKRQLRCPFSFVMGDFRWGHKFSLSYCSTHT